MALLPPTATMGFALESFAEAVDLAFQCQLVARYWRSPRARLAGTSSAPAACCPGRRGDAGARCSASRWRRASCTGCCCCAAWSSNCACSATTADGAAATRGGCGSWLRTPRAVPLALPAAVTATAQAAEEEAGRKGTGRPGPAEVGTLVRGHPDREVGLWSTPADRGRRGGGRRSACCSAGARRSWLGTWRTRATSSGTGEAAAR